MPSFRFSLLLKVAVSLNYWVEMLCGILSRFSYESETFCVFFSPSAWTVGLLADRSEEGMGTPLQYSCLGNPMDRGAWWAAVHGVVKSRTQLSDFTFTFNFHALEKEMATHSGVLAWRIPGTGEPGGLLSMGSHRVGRDWSDLAAANRSMIWQSRKRLDLLYKRPGQCDLKTTAAGFSSSCQYWLIFTFIIKLTSLFVSQTLFWSQFLQPWNWSF